MKDAEKLLAENKVEIIPKTAARVETTAAGGGVNLTVILEGEKQRCTCPWFSPNQ